jgi:hypothetical protein
MTPSLSDLRTAGASVDNDCHPNFGPATGYLIVTPDPGDGAVMTVGRI